MVVADEALGLAAFDEVHRAGNGGVFFAADGVHGVIAHFHDLRAVDQLDAAVVAADSFEFGFKPGRVPRQVQTSDFGKFAQSQRGPFDEFRRSFIVAHGIESDFHRFTINVWR
jgi:hypothetical protein